MFTLSSDAWIMIAAGFGAVGVAVGFHVLLCRDRMARLRHVEKQLTTSHGSSRSRVLGVAIKKFNIDPSISMAADRYDQVAERLREMARRYAQFARWNALLALVPAGLVALSVSQFLKAREVEATEAARRTELREIGDRELALLRRVADAATSAMRIDGLAPVPAVIAGGDPAVSVEATELEQRVADFTARNPEKSQSEDERTELRLATATVAVARNQFHVALLAVGTTTEWGAPYESQVELLRAAVFHGMDQPALALRELERYVRLGDEAGDRRLAGARLRALELKEAASAYNELVDRNLTGRGLSMESLAELYNNRAVARLLLGDFADAQRDFDRAIELESIDRPDETNSTSAGESDSIERLVLRAAMLENRAVALRQLGKLSPALADLDQVLKLYGTIHDRMAPAARAVASVRRSAVGTRRADLLRVMDRPQEALAALADISGTLESLAHGNGELLQVEVGRVANDLVHARTLAAEDDLDAAQTTLDRAVEQCRQLYAQRKTGRLAILLSDCLTDRGQVLAALDAQAALADYRDAVMLLEELELNGWSQVALPLAELLVRRSDLYRDLDQRAGALQDLSRATAIFQRLAAGDRSDFQRQLAGCLARRGDLQREVEHAESLEDYDRSIAIYRRLASTTLDNALRRELAHGLNNRGVVLTRLGKFTDAVSAYSESISLYEELGRRDASSLELVEALATSLHNRAVAYRHSDKLQLAVFDYNEAVELRERLWGEGRPGAASELGSSLNNRAICLRRMMLTAQAIADHNRAVEILTALVEANGELVLARTDLGTYVANRGNAHHAAGDYPLAVRDMERAVALHSELISQGNNELVGTLVASLNNLAWMRATCPDESIRNGAIAVEYATRACELTNWRDPRILATLAVAASAAGDRDAALKWQNKALEIAPEEMKEELRGILELD